MPFNNRASLVLALLAAGDLVIHKNAPVTSIVRLEKMIFLATRGGELLKGEQFSFGPSAFGPFCPEVFETVDFLRHLGLVDEALFEDESGVFEAEWKQVISDVDLENISRPSRQDSILSLTRKGVLAAGERSVSLLSTEEKKALRRLKWEWNRVPLVQLLRYIYRRYPEYTAKGMS